MSALRFFPWPSGGRWLVAYMADLGIVRSVCCCRRFEDAAREARRLNTGAHA